MFRPLKHGGIGGIEGAVHHEGEDDRQRHQQHDGDEILAEKQAEDSAEHSRCRDADHDPAE